MHQEGVQYIGGISSLHQEMFSTLDGYHWRQCSVHQMYIMSILIDKRF